MNALSDNLKKRYEAEGISPDTNALAEYNGKIFWTCEGMEYKAMRTGVLAGKGSTKFPIVPMEVVNPHTGKEISVPMFAVATYKRFNMDQVCTYKSDPVVFTEYAKKPWHFKYPYMYLAKVARSRALRHAFPELFAGTFSYEEATAELSFNENGRSKVEDNRTSSSGSHKVELVLGSSQFDIPEIKTSVSDLVKNVFKKDTIE